MSDPIRGALLTLHIGATPGHVDVEGMEARGDWPATPARPDTPALRDTTGRVWRWLPLSGWFYPAPRFVSAQAAATFRAGIGHGWWCTAWDERVGDWRCEQCREVGA